MKTFLLLLIILRFDGCNDGLFPIKPIERIPHLQEIEDTITIKGRRLFLSTYLQRDFMPICPPDGFPLVALIYLTAIDNARLTGLISPDNVWIINNDSIWKSALRELGAQGGIKPNQIARIAYNGPKWRPNIFVNVFISIHDKRGKIYYVRAMNQLIHRTD